MLNPDAERERKRVWYLANKEHILKRRKRYYQANREREDAYHKKWTAKHPEQTRMHKLKNYTRFKIKYRKSARIHKKIRYHSNPADRIKTLAGQALRYAVRVGNMIRPTSCSSCFKTCKPEAHHHLGYEREHFLHVKWLCHQCHTEAHKALKTVPSILS